MPPLLLFQMASVTERCLILCRSLNCNHLRTVPKELGCLTNITRISLHINRITSLPEELVRILRFLTLPQLIRMPFREMWYTAPACIIPDRSSGIKIVHAGAVNLTPLKRIKDSRSTLSGKCHVMWSHVTTLEGLSAENPVLGDKNHMGCIWVAGGIELICTCALPCLALFLCHTDYTMPQLFLQSIAHWWFLWSIILINDYCDFTRGI